MCLHARRDAQHASSDAQHVSTDIQQIINLLCGVAAGMAPCDILLLLSSSEGDAPKVTELLAAGAYSDIKVRHSCGLIIPAPP